MYLQNEMERIMLCLQNRLERIICTYRIKWKGSFCSLQNQTNWKGILYLQNQLERYLYLKDHSYLWNEIERVKERIICTCGTE